MANASSNRSNIRFRAKPRRPTSVRGSAGSTRRERSPAAIEPAVTPMRSSGRNPIRTSHQASAPSASRIPAMTIASMRSRRCSVASASVSGTAATAQATVARTGRRRHAVARARIGGLDRRERAGRQLCGQRRRGGRIAGREAALVGGRAGRVLRERPRPARRPRRCVIVAVRPGATDGRAVATAAARPEAEAEAPRRFRATRGRGLGLLVDAVKEEVALLDVGDAGEQHEADRGQARGALRRGGFAGTPR